MTRARGAWRRTLLVLAAAAGCALPAAGASVKTWAPSSAADFEKGTMEGTALDGRGHVRLGPAFEPLWGPARGVVWGVAPAAGRAAFVALSGPARLLRIQPGAEPRTWYESNDEVLVTAVALAGSERGAYIGLSPRGEVIHARGPEDRRLLFETGAEFVWALLNGADGTVWAATGSPGRLLRHRGKQTDTVFESGADPVRCLAALPAGGIVAGTGAKGRVIRFSADDRPFVLLDAEEGEIVSLAVAADGTVFAAAAGRPARPAGAAKTKPGSVAGNAVTVRAAPPEKNESPSPPKPSAAPTDRRTPAGAGGAVYRLDPDGGALRIWESDSETPYAVVVHGDGILVGTGGSGRIVQLDRHGEGAGVLRFPSNEASAMAVAPDGRVLVGGTRDARVAAIGPGPAPRGTYLTRPLDAGGVADWGRIRWDVEVPRDAALELEVRSGNTQAPDRTWSPWAAPPARDPLEGATAPAPPARWFQVRVTLEPSAGGLSPVLRRIELFYLPRNHPPRITEIEVHPVGIAWTEMATPTQARSGPLVADDPVARRAAKALNPAARTPRITRTYEAGARTFAWKAADPDGDALRFSLEIRREGETRWFPLRRDLDGGFFSWDSRAMPDGLYRVRLTADDAKDNPNGKHYTTTRESETFRVDNTPPRVLDFEMRRRKQGYEIGFVARDPGGRVDAAQFALDGEDWRSLDPVDGVADSAEERYRIVLGAAELRTRPTHLVVRVTDAAGNLGGDMRALEPPPADDAD